MIGIGLNIGPREATGLSTAPAWIQQWRPGASAPELLREIVLPLVDHVLLFGERGFVPFAERFAARDVLRGREVQLSDGTVGRCEGVGWGGELLVRTASGMKTDHQRRSQRAAACSRQCCCAHWFLFCWRPTSAISPGPAALSPCSAPRRRASARPSRSG